MSKQRALTYSVLSYIRSKGDLVEGPIDIFVPLIKRALSKMHEEGTYSGASIAEIKTIADSLYAIDFPIPVLETILKKIAKEINTEKEIKFILNQDRSFQITNYVFTEFEQTIRLHKSEIDNLERFFKEFCETCGELRPDSSSILDFIETNKQTLSKYLAHTTNGQERDFTVEAQFVKFFKQIPPVYDLIKRIYLGSILSSYIEYKTTDIKTNVELLLDTNFILGLFDLNTPESTHTCRKLVEIISEQGYKLKVLQDTIYECMGLLKAKAEHFDTTFLQRKVYTEDIYNACERRGLNKADLERISDNFEKELGTYGILIVYDTTKYKNIAKYSPEYKILRQIRNTDAAALHDATAIHYVRIKRQKKIKEFENVNCWFVNNALNRGKVGHDWEKNRFEFQPELIKADDFLNIIWLSNPQININVNADELSDIGITSLISLTLSDSLPKAAIIRELDDNIHKYAAEELTDNDIVRIATRITNKQLKDIETLNKLAKNNKEEFIKRLNQEAKKQAKQEGERIKKLDKLFKELSDKGKSFHKLKAELEHKTKTLDGKLSKLQDQDSSKDGMISELSTQLAKEKRERIKDENKRRHEKRKEYLNKQVGNWRRKTLSEFALWLLVAIGGIIFLLWKSNWQIDAASKLAQTLHSNFIISVLIFLLGAVFTGVTIRTLFNKYRNHSNIEAYKKGIDIPDDLKDIEVEEK